MILDKTSLTISDKNLKTDKHQWKKIKSSAPIVSNLQTVIKSLKCVIGEVIKKDAEGILAMAEHLKERQNIDSQLLQRPIPTATQDKKGEAF